MKKKITAMLSVLLIAIVLSGCKYSQMETTYEEDAEAPPSMFVEVEKGFDYYVVYHKDTKVMYVASDGAYNHGTFTLLVDENGDPLLYEGE